MSTLLASDPDPRVDRLFALLPAVHRLRDADNGYPLKALLRVIAEQVNVVEDDITQLYDNQFIETAADWAVPYIGDLVGYRPVADAGLPADAPGATQPRVLVPRREVANTIAWRRRKGTLALLEELANGIAGWPARAVEFFRLLGWTQNVNHLHLHRHRTADLRHMESQDLLGSPFERIAHSVDLRRPDSRHTRGRFDIPSVEVFVWRLRSYPVTATPACCVEEAGPHCFTFSVLGNDAPLFVHPQPERCPTHIADELNLPAAIRRRAFEHRPGDYVGTDLSLSIKVDGWAGFAGTDPVPVAQLLAADLTDWRYVPPNDFIAVDPVLGRLAFPTGQLPRKGVRVSYRQGFPADLGGGEYARTQPQPAQDFHPYRVGEKEKFTRLSQALDQWRQDKPDHAVIEFANSGVIVEPIAIVLADRQTLQLRAASGARPVLRMIDWQTDLPDALTVTLGQGSRVSFDGLMVTGRPVQVVGAAAAGAPPSPCGGEVVIRHCTLVPGWGLDCDCEPRRPAEPSLMLTNVRARVRIEHSVVGAIEVQEDEVRLDPIPLCISDSILDATSPDRHAIGALGATWAHATLDIRRCTVRGIIDVHAMQLGENCLFSCVNVARRQIGCVRYSWVPTDCRTPRRHACQPDGVIAAVKARWPGDAARQASEIADETLRVEPQFNDQRYGRPDYMQLSGDCAVEITRGADDESEMGAYHDLYQPQREANLRTRLAEYTPAGMDVGIVFVN